MLVTFSIVQIVFLRLEGVWYIGSLMCGKPCIDRVPAAVQLLLLLMFVCVLTCKASSPQHCCPEWPFPTWLASRLSEVPESNQRPRDISGVGFGPLNRYSLPLYQLS